MTQTDQQIQEQIKACITKCIGVEPEQIHGDSSIQHELGADSLDDVELCMEVEKAFSIAITDDEWNEVHTLNQIMVLVKQKLTII